MRPPPLRPLLPPPAIRRRQQNPSPLFSPSAFAPASSAFDVYAHFSYASYSPAAHHPAYTPAVHNPTLSTFHRRPSSKNPQTRGYAIQTPGPLTLQVFNAATKHKQRERAASNADASRRVDYLRDEVATRLCERLLVNLPDGRCSEFSVCSWVTHSIPSGLGHGWGNLGYQTPLPAHPRPRG